MEIILQKSKATNKKLAAIITQNNKKKTVNFGDSRYEDFTTHGDEERRQRYLKRHQNDKINNIYKPGYWSWYILWNKKSIE